jgi:hypothetical protein
VISMIACALSPLSPLLLPQCLQRIDLCRSAGRHITGEQRQRCQQRWCAEQETRIIGTNLERVDKSAGQCRKYFSEHKGAQESKNGSGSDQSGAFAQHQPQHLSLTRAQRHADSNLSAPLRDPVSGDPGESDCRQHQPEHSNSAVSTDGETLGGAANLQVVAEGSNIEEVQVRIDGSDLAPNAAQPIGSHPTVR